jgi:hypothetical protein
MTRSILQEGSVMTCNLIVTKPLICCALALATVRPKYGLPPLSFRRLQRCGRLNRLQRRRQQMRSTMKWTKVSYCSVIALALLTVAPFKAHALGLCGIKPGNQAVFGPSGNVVRWISGPQQVRIYQRIVREAPPPDSSGRVHFPDVAIAQYRINVPGGFYTVYKIDGRNEYIDISSCASLAESG